MDNAQTHLRLNKPARLVRAGLVGALLASTVIMAGTFSAPGVLKASESVAQAAFDRGYADLAERVLPSVVNVSVERVMQSPAQQADPRMERFFERFFGPDFRMPDQPHGQERPMRGEGSGFIIDEGGLIVTNAHVVKGADKITVTLQDNREISASLQGIDEKTDLALLKVNETGLPAVRFADSDAVRVGDKVLAVGNPFGLGGTVTSGIISATGRELGSGPYDDFLQVDAAINRGNSGGPTFNLDGEVVGVNTMIFSPSGGNVGIGFAISANLAQMVIADLADDGIIERGWLGVSIQPLDDNLSEALGLPDTGGALVAAVVEGSPAAAAGLDEGDVILGFEGTVIDRPSTLSKAVAARDPGSASVLEVWRDGERIELEVRLGTLEDQNLVVSSVEERDTTSDQLGMALAPMSDADRQRTGLELDREGVVVSAVDPDGPAARQNIREGDVILSIDNKSVGSAGDVADAIADAREAGREAVAVLIARERGQLFTALTLADS